MSDIISGNNLWFEGFVPVMSNKKTANVDVENVKNVDVLGLLFGSLIHFDGLLQTRDALKKHHSISPYLCDSAANRVDELKNTTRKLCVSITAKGIFRSQSILRILYNIEELTDDLSKSIGQLRIICLDDMEETRELQQEITESLDDLLNLGSIMRGELANINLGSRTTFHIHQ